MDVTLIERKLVFVRNGGMFVRAKNKSGGGVAAGDVVIYDTTNSNTKEIACKTTTTADDALVLGMCVNSAADGGYVDVLISGTTADLKVDGTTDIAIGDFISTFTTAKIGQKATAGKAGAFAIALEAYSTNDSLGVIDALLVGPASRMDASSSVSYGTVGQLATPGLAAANAAGTTAASARVDHVHIAKVNDDVSFVFGTTDVAGTAAQMQYDTAETVDALKLGLDATSRRLIIMDYGDLGVDTTLAAANDPELVLMDATAVDWFKLHTTLVGAEYDVKSANTHRFLINGTLEASISAAGMVLEAGNTIQHLGAQAGDRVFLSDVNGNEVLDINPVASAVNYVLLKNSASGTGVEFAAAGDDTNIPLLLTAKGTSGLRIDNGTDPVSVRLMGAADSYTNYLSDLSGNEILGLQGVTSAVNELNIKSAATGSRPTLESTGGDANVGITILAKGSGSIVLDNGTDPVKLGFFGAAGGFNNQLIDVNGNELMTFQGVASAVNEISISNAITTSNPSISATGSDTNISMTVLPKGTGSFNINNDTDPVLLSFRGAAGSVTNYITDVNANELLGFQGTASAVNEFNMINAATSTSPKLTVTGGDAGVGMELQTKGVGWLHHRASTVAGTNGSVAFHKSISAYTNDGINTLTAADFRGGIVTHSGQTASRADTTPTAAALVADIVGAQVGTSYWFIYANTDDASDAVLTAGAGVTFVGNGTVAAGKAAMCLVHFTNVTGASEAVTIFIVQPV